MLYTHVDTPHRFCSVHCEVMIYSDITSATKSCVRRECTFLLMYRM